MRSGTGVRSVTLVFGPRGCDSKSKQIRSAHAKAITARPPREPVSLILSRRSLNLIECCSESRFNMRKRRSSGTRCRLYNQTSLELLKRGSRRRSSDVKARVGILSSPRAINASPEISERPSGNDVE